jgi:hypothetical protein
MVRCVYWGKNVYVMIIKNLKLLSLFNETMKMSSSNLMDLMKIYAELYISIQMIQKRHPRLLTRSEFCSF